MAHGRQLATGFLSPGILRYHNIRIYLYDMVYTAELRIQQMMERLGFRVKVRGPTSWDLELSPGLGTSSSIFMG